MARIGQRKTIKLVNHRYKPLTTIAGRELHIEGFPNLVIHSSVGLHAELDGSSWSVTETTTKAAVYHTATKDINKAAKEAEAFLKSKGVDAFNERLAINQKELAAHSL